MAVFERPSRYARERVEGGRSLRRLLRRCGLLLAREEAREALLVERGRRPRLPCRDAREIGRDLRRRRPRQGLLRLHAEPRQLPDARPGGRQPLGQRRVVAHQEKDRRVAGDVGPEERVPGRALEGRKLHQLPLCLRSEKLRVQPVVLRQRLRSQLGVQELHGLPVELHPGLQALGCEALELPVPVVAAGLGGLARKELEVLLDVARNQFRGRGDGEGKRQHEVQHGPILSKPRLR